MKTAAFEVLRNLQLAARANSVAVPFGEKNEPRWQGIGYQLGGVRLVSSMGEVLEVLKVPRYTPVPGVREWMLGIANIRGRLIPIIDLHSYLGIEQTLPQALARVLVVEAGPLVGGLMGEASLGISHFALSSFEPPGEEVPTAFAPIVRGIYRQGGRVFHEARLSGLLGEEKFHKVALFVDEVTERRERRSAMEL